MLGIPVIPISAAKNEGIDELVQHALHVAKISGKTTDYRIFAMLMKMAEQYIDASMRSCI